MVNRRRAPQIRTDNNFKITIIKYVNVFGGKVNNRYEQIQKFSKKLTMRNKTLNDNSRTENLILKMKIISYV